MNAKEQLIRELDQAPDFLIEEVLNFFLFLKTRLFSRLNSAPNPPLEKSESLFLSWIDDISSHVPEEEWEKLPADLSQNLDHYLYGTPKQS